MKSSNYWKTAYVDLESKFEQLQGEHNMAQAAVNSPNLEAQLQRLLVENQQLKQQLTESSHDTYQLENRLQKLQNKSRQWTVSFEETLASVEEDTAIYVGHLGDDDKPEPRWTIGGTNFDEISQTEPESISLGSWDTFDEQEDSARSISHIPTKSSILNTHYMFENFCIIQHFAGKLEIRYAHKPKIQERLLEYLLPLEDAKPFKVSVRQSQEHLFDISQTIQYIQMIKIGKNKKQWSQNWFKPNKDQEHIYIACLQTREIIVRENQHWSVPVLYWFLTYFPYFSLHNQILNRILSISRYQASLGLWLNAIETSSDVQNLLKYYYDVDLRYTDIIELDLDSMDLEIVVTEDENMLDLFWSCPFLFSHVPLGDFWLIYIAFLLEWSIVLVGDDLETVSGWVLALQALIRPFVWPYVCIPILPRKLKYIMDCKVPYLVGVKSGQALPMLGDKVVYVDLENQCVYDSMRIRESLPLPSSQSLIEKIKNEYDTFSQPTN